jgi:hypothetical protein
MNVTDGKLRRLELRLAMITGILALLAATWKAYESVVEWREPISVRAGQEQAYIPPVQLVRNRIMFWPRDRIHSRFYVEVINRGKHSIYVRKLWLDSSLYEASGELVSRLDPVVEIPPAGVHRFRTDWIHRPPSDFITRVLITTTRRVHKVQPEWENPVSTVPESFIPAP